MRPVKMMEENSPEKNKPIFKYARYSSLAFQMMAAIGIGVWGGMKLDKYFQTKFVFTLFLLLVALLGGFYWVYKDLTNKNN